MLSLPFLAACFLCAIAATAFAVALYVTRNDVR